MHSRYSRQLPKREKIDIFVNTLVLELYYDLRKDLFSSFNDMIERMYCIENVIIKNGNIVINRDTRGNGNGKDKSKSWNKNRYVINDGVVYVPKAKKSTFHLSNAIYVAKQQEFSKPQDVAQP